jgi:hypothetical protein
MCNRLGSLIHASMISGLAGILFFSPATFGQTSGMPRAKAKEPKASAPAPPRNINGVWYHEGGGATLNKIAPLTPLGEKLFRANRPKSPEAANAVTIADSNDPMVTCDPLGFPRNILYEIRGMEFIQAPTKMVQLFQYQKAWREIWTDGRALPKNVGGSDLHAPDPRYYGYSVGHWEGDDTFVVDTVGMDDRTWVDTAGHPHSNALHVKENYTRLDHDHLQDTVLIDDPKIYTHPYIASTVKFVWNPKQEFEEQLCIPSDAQAYMDVIGNPASAKKK